MVRPADTYGVTPLAGSVAATRTEPRPPRWWQQAWELPLWAHLLALAVGLLLLVPVVGTSQSFLADEGAAVIQARSLEAGEGWIVEHPLPEVDPDGGWYPVVNAEHGDKGFAPLAKHPAYPVLAAAAMRLAGVTGIVLLSLAGTVAAAGLAAALAGRVDRSLVRPTLWVVGVGSPMLFDGFLAMAHTLGAALATAAVLAAVVAVQDHRPKAGLLVALPMAGAVLLRNEALLFAAALVLAAGVVWIRRPYRAAAATVAAATLVATIGARLVERVWIARITGGAVAATSVGVPASGDSLLRGRVDGFLRTWLNPGDGGPLSVRIALLLILPAIVWCVLRIRADPDDRTGILGSAAVAAAAAVAAVLIAPDNIVPGLLVAFPVATAGMMVLRRSLFNDVGPLLLGVTAAAFAGAVLATQYAEGGIGEWGGRYFALAVPAAVPLLLAGLRRQGLVLPTSVRRGVAVALGICAMALSTMAVTALRSSHQGADEVVSRIETAAQSTGDPRPVVLTTWIGGPRLAWPIFEDHRWLYVRNGDVATAASRLRETGIDRFVFLSLDFEADRSQLAGFTVVSRDGSPEGEGTQILVLKA